jgi:hypothetical protein
MSKPVTFIDLSPGTQDLILGNVGKWLNYAEIRYLVGSFNIHNRSSSPCKITSFALLNTLQFIHNVILALAGDPELQESYLIYRFLEVVQTKDLKVSYKLISDPSVVKRLRTFSLTQFREALYDGTQKGHFETISVLQKIDFPSTVQFLGLVVSHAAAKGYAQLIRELLKKHVIGNDMRGNALGAAAANGCLETVELLDNKEITEDLRGSAVMNAAEGGHIEIIRVLLRNGTISADNRDMAKQLAARNGHHEVVEELSTNLSFKS